MEKEEILKIIREREEKIDFVKRCVRVHLCPKCGEGNLFALSTGHPFLIKYECNNNECKNTLVVND